MSDIAVIKQKLTLLQEKDSSLQIFGAAQHQYQLQPCLTEAHLQEFEQQHGVLLPAAYRLFLREIGNGGAGPYYGIAALDASVPTQAAGGDPAVLAQPFPLAEGIAILQVCAGMENLDPYYARIEDDEEYADQVRACVQQYSAPAYRQGTLRVCDYGCGITFFLVVTGAERDHIWVDDIVDDAGYFPLTAQADAPATRVDFLTWYENWLDWSLQTLAGPERAPEGTYFEYGYPLAP